MSVMAVTGECDEKKRSDCRGQIAEVNAIAASHVLKTAGRGSRCGWGLAANAKAKANAKATANAKAKAADRSVRGTCAGELCYKLAAHILHRFGVRS